MKLAGANPNEGFRRRLSPRKSELFHRQRSEEMDHRCEHLRESELQQVYKGIDLVYYGHSSNWNTISWWRPEPIRGRSRWNSRAPSPGSPERRPGADVDGAPLSFRKPTVYQMIDGKRQTIAGGYRVTGDRVQFALGKYDHSRALVIDPVLTYFTYLGGKGNDYVGNVPPYIQFPISPSQSIAADQAGNLYITGFTGSIDFPVQGAVQSQNKATPVNRNPVGRIRNQARSDRVTPDLFHLSWRLRGRSDESIRDCHRSAGSAYITGFTQQSTFRLPRAHIRPFADI